MIEFLKGEVAFKADDYIVVDVNNIGYKVNMAKTTIEKIETGSILKIYTYMRVLQDDVSLFGFLSNIVPTDFAIAVVSEDTKKLKALPGIGPKTAQRIILELKDKVKHEQAIEESRKIEKKIEKTQNVKDAISALQVLGYNLKSIEKAFSNIDVDGKQTEELIKLGLKELA